MQWNYRQGQAVLFIIYFVIVLYSFVDLRGCPVVLILRGACPGFEVETGIGFFSLASFKSGMKSLNF